VLNLYSHYFALFLVAAQACGLVVVAFRNSAVGVWTSSHRNRLFVYGLLTLALVAVAYAPWLGVLRRIVSESVPGGRMVWAGGRVGRGVTLKLVGTSLFDSMGQGPIPFLFQAALVVVALTARRYGRASLLFLVTWILPFVLLKTWRPGHFIAAKYFIFAYPVTVAMVGAGMVRAAEAFARGRGWASRAFWVLLAVVSLSPLLPGQHEPYACHRADWRTIVMELETRMGERDKLSFPADTKTYAMVMHYAGDEFLRKHPVILWRPVEGARPFLSLEPGTGAWLLKRGGLPAPLAEGLAAGLETVATWKIYPDSVSLYHFVSK